jgi:excisionase family DNA binding protein
MTRTMPAPTRTLVGLTEAAQFAGVCTRTIRNWIAENRIAGYRVGPRLIRVDLAELEASMLQPMNSRTAA